jgi:hypothetical protein
MVFPISVPRNDWRSCPLAPTACATTYPTMATRRLLVAVIGLWAIMVVGLHCAWFGGSGAAVHLQSGAHDPAAQGEVKTKLTNDGNTAVIVTVKHLAPADRLAAGATTYVVWARPLGAPAEPATGTRTDPPPGGRDFNLGGLKIDQDLGGSLETTTPFHSFELFITAESSSSVTTPTSQRALWATVTRE